MSAKKVEGKEAKLQFEQKPKLILGVKSNVKGGPIIVVGRPPRP